MLAFVKKRNILAKSDVSWKMGDKLIVKGKKNESKLLNKNFFNSVQRKEGITQGHLIGLIVDNDK